MRISICLLVSFLFSIAHVNLALGQFVDPDGSVIVGFTEGFESGVANFTDANRNLATLFETGGVDNSAFIRAATDPDFQGVVLRAELDGRGPGPASGGAFAGDFIASNVESISFFLRHDNTEDATFSIPPVRIFVLRTVRCILSQIVSHPMYLTDWLLVAVVKWFHCHSCKRKSMKIVMVLLLLCALIGCSGSEQAKGLAASLTCLLYTSPSPRDATLSRMPSSA